MRRVRTGTPEHYEQTDIERVARPGRRRRRVRMRRVRAGTSLHHEQTVRERVARPCLQAVQRAGFSGGKRKGAEGARQAMQWSLHDWARLDQSKVPRLADILLPYFRFCHCKEGPAAYRTHSPHPPPWHLACPWPLVP